MGVPITYLDKHNEKQFSIIGADFDLAKKMDLGNGKFGTGRFYSKAVPEGEAKRLYSRIVIKASCKHCNGVIGVPITFMDKHNPEQFSVIGHEHDLTGNGGEGIKHGQFEYSGRGFYKRILICASKK